MLKFLSFFGHLLYIIFEDIPSHKFGDSTQETMKEIVRWKRLRSQMVEAVFFHWNTTKDNIYLKKKEHKCHFASYSGAVD